MQGLDETPLTYIDTQPALESLAEELASVREMAVDLEAHAYRSFQGFCCLMQLSTRKADYLVDVLALRSGIGPVLGPVFADGKARLHSERSSSSLQQMKASQTPPCHLPDRADNQQMD